MLQMLCLPLSGEEPSTGVNRRPPQFQSVTRMGISRLDSCCAACYLKNPEVNIEFALTRNTASIDLPSLSLILCFNGTNLSEPL